MVNAGLILEGGGMRGIYTAGVLDYFMDKDLYFSETYAVSAGACNACSYISKQKGRAYRIFTDYRNDKRYCSLYSLLTTGDIFGVDMAYNLIPNQYDPYDYDTFDKHVAKEYAVVTNCKTGKAEYMEIKDSRKDIVAIRASSSMPLVSKMVEINGEKYLDGGIADSIPLRKSRKNGNKKNVIILTRDTSYRKEKSSARALFRIKYRNYPKLIKAMEQRHENYNKSLDFVEKERKAGNVFVIQPSHAVAVGRIEKDIQKLKLLYDEGYGDAKKHWADMMHFLE